MSLRANRFLMLCNRTGMVILCAFHSCWRLFALDQIQLDAYYTVVCRRYEVTLKLASDSYWKKRNDWVSKKTTTTNLNRNHVAYPTLFHVVGTQCLVSVFLPVLCLLPVFFPGDSQFYEEDTLFWIVPRYNVRPLFCLNNVNWKL